MLNTKNIERLIWKLNEEFGNGDYKQLEREVCMIESRKFRRYNERNNGRYSINTSFYYSSIGEVRKYHRLNTPKQEYVNF